MQVCLDTFNFAFESKGEIITTVTLYVKVSAVRLYNLGNLLSQYLTSSLSGSRCRVINKFGVYAGLYRYTHSCDDPRRGPRHTGELCPQWPGRHDVMMLDPVQQRAK